MTSVHMAAGATIPCNSVTLIIVRFLHDPRMLYLNWEMKRKKMETNSQHIHVLSKCSLSKEEGHIHMTDRKQIVTQFHYVSVKKNYVINAELCHTI